MSRQMDSLTENSILLCSYGAEIHLVHYNTKYESLGDAADKADGLAVLGILVDTAAYRSKRFFRVMDGT